MTTPPSLIDPRFYGIPGLAHGFFGRQGGVSEGPVYGGLNCGPGSADDPAKVAANRALVAAALGFAPVALATLHQVHSARVVTLAAPPVPGVPRAEADALVTATPGVLLGVLSADCAPLLFVDPAARVIGAAHAGWRGAKAGIAEATVAAMQALGADAQRIEGAIGPTIGPASYQVAQDFVDAFAGDPWASRHLMPDPAAPGRFCFHLPGYLRDRLASIGVERVVWTGADTLADPARFFSHRASRRAGFADYGRMIAAIGLQE